MSYEAARAYFSQAFSGSRRNMTQGTRGMHPDRLQDGPPPTRRLAQPGPALEPRVESLAARTLALDLTLEPGLSLLEAVARPLRRAGFASAVLELRGGGFGPFAYVLPAHAPD